MLRVYRYSAEATSRSGKQPTLAAKCPFVSAYAGEHRTEPPPEKLETEDDELIRALKEAHVHLTTASSHVRTTYVHFSSVLHEYMAHVDTVCNDLLLLRPSPANS